MRVNFINLTGIATFSAMLWSLSANGQDEPGPVWVGMSDGERRNVVSFVEDYKDFMRRAKNEKALGISAAGFIR